MPSRNWQFGSIATNVLLPWLLMLLLTIGLAGYRYYQSRVLETMDEYSGLHRQAVFLAKDLSYLAERRRAAALSFQRSHDPLQRSSIEATETEALAKIEKLAQLFSGDDPQLNSGVAARATGFIESYRTIREGQFELYAQFIRAVESNDEAHQAKLVSLLNDKLRLVRSALDDLVNFHIALEQQVAERQQTTEEQANVTFLGLLGALILAGLGFSWFQSQSVVRPLTALTVAARKISAGETAEFRQLSAKGEIGELGAALAQMVDALRQSHAELNAQKNQLVLAYAEIEEKVRQRTIELQRRSAELETANADLEGFSYSVSHDLRAPLRAIDGFIAILLEDYAGNLDAEGQRLFGIVSDNARKMGHLIDDILAFSRAGRLELDHATVDMNALLDEVWGSFAEQRGDRPIEFRCADLPPVAGDVRALRQVWQNLIGNAIKFTRDRRPAIVEVSSEPRGGMIWFSVKDNGAGFNSEYHHKLFGLFQRLHGMDEFEGTGVGLAIVKRFVQKHGGQVAAEGGVDAGATFRFGLPPTPGQPLS